MSRNLGSRSLFLAVALFSTVAAHADLVGAQKAYAAKDFAAAFQQFLEIATLGNVTAQENVAAMYVDGEGVARDNVLGYAWAVIARENGGNAAMQNIIDQLQPHLDEKARARVSAVTDRYGKAALAERLLPARPVGPRTPSKDNCRITRPANPDDSYPAAAVREGLSGSVILDASISADGRAHHPIVLYSIPQLAFDNAARVNAFTTVFAPRRVDGAVVPCAIRYKVKYRAKSGTNEAAIDDAMKKARVLAEQGDPIAQSVYGLLELDRGGAAPPSRDWFLESAQAGVPFSQYVVGITLAGEASTLPDAEKIKGFAWLKLAAAAGQPDAKFALANYTLRHEPGALQDSVVFAWLEDATRAGHRDATLCLAALLAAGPADERRDPARALSLLRDSKWSFDDDPTAHEITAAAHAQLKHMDEAVTAQKRAVGLARGYGWDLARLQDRLAKYQDGMAWTGNLMEP